MQKEFYLGHGIKTNDSNKAADIFLDRDHQKLVSLLSEYHSGADPLRNSDTHFWIVCLKRPPKVNLVLFQASNVKLLEILGKWNAKKGKIFKILCLKMPILAHKKSKRPHKTT